MFIFLLLAFPIFIYFLIHLEGTSKSWVDFITFKEHGLPFVRGMLIYIPAIIFLSLFRGVFNETYSPFGRYFYHLMEDHFIYLAVLIAGYILFTHLFNGDDSFLTYSIFAAGFLTVASIITVILYYNQFDSYLLFLLPLLRFSMIFISSCLITRLINSEGIMKILLFAGLALVAFALGFVTYLYKNNFIFLSSVLGIVLFILTFFIMVRFKE